MDLYSFGVCVKGKDDNSTEVLINTRKWVKLSKKEKIKKVEYILNFCYYKKYNHNRNVYYF